MSRERQGETAATAHERPLEGSRDGSVHLLVTTPILSSPRWVCQGFKRSRRGLMTPVGWISNPKCQSRTNIRQLCGKQSMGERHQEPMWQWQCERGQGDVVRA